MAEALQLGGQEAVGAACDAVFHTFGLRLGFRPYSTTMRLLTGSAADAEDLTAQVFLRRCKVCPAPATAVAAGLVKPDRVMEFLHHRGKGI